MGRIAAGPNSGWRTRWSCRGARSHSAPRASEDHGDAIHERREHIPAADPRIVWSPEGAELASYRAESTSLGNAVFAVVVFWHGGAGVKQWIGLGGLTAVAPSGYSTASREKEIRHGRGIVKEEVFVFGVSSSGVAQGQGRG